MTSTKITIGDLTGKRVLVTGGSTGIGAAVVLGLVEQGAQVAVHYNASQPEAEQLRTLAPSHIHLRQGDLAASGIAARVVDEAALMLGGLDGLINNAGSHAGPRSDNRGVI